MTQAELAAVFTRPPPVTRRRIRRPLRHSRMPRVKHQTRAWLARKVAQP